MSIQALNWALTMPGSPTQKHVLLVLANFADETGLAWPSTELLTKATGLSDRSIRDAKKHILHLGLIAPAPERGRCGVRLQLEISNLEAELRSRKAEGVSEERRKEPPLKRKMAPPKRKLLPSYLEPPITTTEPSFIPLTPLRRKKHSRGSRPELPDWLPLDAWNGWLEMRREKHAPLTARGVKLTLRKLEEFRADGDEPGDVLDQSTERGWTGVFPLKSRGNVVTPATARSPHQQPPKSEIRHPFDGFMEEFCGGTLPFYEHEGADRELLIKAGVIGA